MKLTKSPNRREILSTLGVRSMESIQSFSKITISSGSDCQDTGTSGAAK